MLIAPSGEEALFSGASIELEQLRDAVVQYQIETNTNSQAVASLARHEWTWEKVQDAVKEAAREEGSDDESSIVKSSCSKIIENIPAFEAWLGLLPAGDYGAVICGLFKVVVGVLDTSACQQHHI